MRTDKEFRDFFYTFYFPVSRFIVKYVEEEETAADIAQEVFIRTYGKWKEFKQEENAKAFLYTIAHNLALDYLKHKKVESNYLNACLEKDGLEEVNFLKEVTRQETFRILYSAIDKLPEQTRQVILLSLDGKSVNEVGEEMGISPNTVKTLKKNGYAALRKLLPKGNMVILLVLLRSLYI